MTGSPNENMLGVANLYRLIREVPNFPQQGVTFRDITPLLADPAGLALAVEYLAQPFRGKHVDVVVGAESRGFVLGTAVAQALSVGFIPVRKAGKLPGPVRQCKYELEYGTDAFEIREDAIKPDQNVLIIDDVLATGGTLDACCRLVRELQGRIHAIGVLIELTALRGRDRLDGHQLVSILRY